MPEERNTEWPEEKLAALSPEGLREDAEIAREWAAQVVDGLLTSDPRCLSLSAFLNHIADSLTSPEPEGEGPRMKLKGLELDFQRRARDAYLDGADGEARAYGVARNAIHHLLAAEREGEGLSREALERRLVECEDALTTVEAAAKEAQSKLAGRQLVDKLTQSMEAVPAVNELGAAAPTKSTEGVTEEVWDSEGRCTKCRGYGRSGENCDRCARSRICGYCNGQGWLERLVDHADENGEFIGTEAVQEPCPHCKSNSEGVTVELSRLEKLLFDGLKQDPDGSLSGPIGEAIADRSSNYSLEFCSADDICEGIMDGLRAALEETGR